MRISAVVFLGVVPLSFLFVASLFAQQAQVVTATPGARGSNATIQQKVDTSMTYHRVMAIVPFTGSGTPADPKRPMFAPTAAALGTPLSVAQVPGAAPASATASTTHTGIIGWQHVPSDDGTLALVELVAVDRSAFAALFASTDPRVQVFEVGASTQAQIQAAFQQKKASFSFSTFHPLNVQ